MQKVMNIIGLLDSIDNDFKEINTILATYDNNDPTVKELKKRFSRVIFAITKADQEEYSKACPCKPECDF